jgi:hypothetical protein
VWRFFTKRWDETLEKFPGNSHSRLALGINTFIGDDAFGDEVAAFHAAHPLSGDQRTVDQQIERMRVGLDFARTVRQQF